MHEKSFWGLTCAPRVKHIWFLLTYGCPKSISAVLETLEIYPPSISDYHFSQSRLVSLIAAPENRIFSVFLVVVFGASSTFLKFRTPFHSWAQNVHSPNLLKRKCTSEVARICIIIIFHLSKLWKAKFSILCDVIFLVGLEGKFDIDHSQEWKGYISTLIMRGVILVNLFIRETSCPTNQPRPPNFKKYILPTVYKEMYKWCNENLVVQSFFIWVSYEKPRSSYCMVQYYWWGCRRNLNLIRVKISYRALSWPRRGAQITFHHFHTKCHGVLLCICLGFGAVEVKHVV